ncbi:uncharacterized protein RB166_001930 isoform 1-T1 [Leptodactylus fuscus]|uniref:uncharacterized protein LOC142194873 isoform X1 n=1 Tax=Leptodactylus fuscus TaxID=238119 RepID=UPI003F4EE97A
MLAINSWIILLICTTLCISAEQCSIKILGEYQIIEEMISTQGYFCSMPVKILNKEHVEEKCDRWALVYELEGLLEKLNFTRGTDNYNKKNHLIQTYISCIENEDYSIKDAANAYLQTVNMNAIEILQRINHSLHELDGFKAEAGSSSDCELYYNKQRQSNGVSTKSPQCACPSPTIPISSSETAQTSLSYISEFASSTYTTSYSINTSPLAEDMTGSYPEKLISPQKSSQGLDSPQIIFTNMPSDRTPLTTLIDHSHADTTMQSGDFSDFPLTDDGLLIHSTEFTKGIQEPSYVSPNPSQTNSDPTQVTKDASDSGTGELYESVASPTIESPRIPTYPVIDEEFSTVMEPEIHETTMREFGLQSSKGSVFQNSHSVPSKEPGIETSSSSVTKIRRSLANMDATSRAAVMTQTGSSLSTNANEPNLLFLNSVYTTIPSTDTGLSHTEAPEPVSQGKVTEDRNLGWASSYISSSRLTTKTELSVSSPVPEGQHPLSDVTHKPVLNAHKSYNIVPQQERDIATDDRQNTFSGPNYSSNMLRIVATEQFEDGRKKEDSQSNLQLIIIVLLVVFVLLFLSGFLYYRHQYRELERRLNTRCNLDLTENPIAVLPEERERLSITACDIV